MVRLNLFMFSVSLLIISPTESGAVGGISNSKIIVPSTDTVPQKRFELEPFFGFSRADDSSDSKNFNFGSRFTIGLLNNLEVGFNLNYLNIIDSNDTDKEFDFGNIDAGLKYRILDQGKSLPFSLAYQAGLAFPTGGDDESWFFEPFGVIITRNHTEKLSSDADFVLSFDEDGTVGIVSNLGIGYFISENFQPVIEAAYLHENLDEDEAIHVISGTAGFTAHSMIY